MKDGIKIKDKTDIIKVDREVGEKGAETINRRETEDKGIR